MSEIYGYIYLIRNKINNKCYIGQTTSNFKERYSYNLIKRTHNDHLRKSLVKYGLENFEIIEEFDKAYSKNELDILEDLYIKVYNLTNPDLGYNNKTGGANGKMNKMVRNKMSINHKGLKNHACRKIICLNDNKVFNYIGEASEYYKIAPNTITQSIKRGKSGTTDKKLVFMYYDDCIKLSENDISEILNKRQNYHKRPNSKKVVCLTTGEIFKSVTEACTKYGIYRSNLSKCCKGHEKYNHCGKLKDGTPLKWKYI